MTCTYYSDKKHNWIKLLEIGDTDYSPGTSAFWCVGCGRAATQNDFDNRTFNVWEKSPLIHNQLTPEAPKP